MTAKENIIQIIQTEFGETLPRQITTLLDLLELRDGAAKLTLELPKFISPSEVAAPTQLQRVWELCGLYFLNNNRAHEALPIFYGLYDQMLQSQEVERVHKGMPLV